VRLAETVRGHLRAAGGADPLLATARSLTAYANAEGGSDNITVAIVPVPQ
jgi:serine/threonine protein phosphatase PrpC